MYVYKFSQEHEQMRIELQALGCLGRTKCAASFGIFMQLQKRHFSKKGGRRICAPASACVRALHANAV